MIIASLAEESLIQVFTEAPGQPFFQCQLSLSEGLGYLATPMQIIDISVPFILTRIKTLKLKTCRDRSAKSIETR